MEDKDLFDVPEELKETSLAEIKEDTSAIRDVLEKNGGLAIRRMKEAEKLQKEQIAQLAKNERVDKSIYANPGKSIKNNKHKSTRSQDREIREIEKAIKQGILLAEKKKKKVLKEEKYNSESEKKNRLKKQNARKKRKINNNKDENSENAKFINSQRRDKNGRFVRSSSDDFGDEKREKRLLDTIKNVGEGIENANVENIDPAIDAFKEVKGGFDKVIGVFSPIKSIFGKFFGGNDEQRRWRSNFFSFLKKSTKESDKKQRKVLEWLKSIWEKDEGGSAGFLGFGKGFFTWLVTAFTAFVFKPLKTVVAKLGGLVATMAVNGLGKLSSLFGSIAGVGRLGKLKDLASGGLSKLGGIGRLAKGFGKRIPLLGGLFSVADIVMGATESGKDENGNSIKGQKIGSGVGSIAGMAIGSFAGPIGTVVGGVIGDVVGEQIGAWLAKLNWAEVGDWFKSTWDNTVGFISRSWDSVTNKLSNAWEGVRTYVTDKLSNAWDGVRTYVTDKVNVVTSKTKSVYQSTKESVVTGYNKLKDWLGFSTENNQQQINKTESFSNENNQQQINKTQNISSSTSAIFNTSNYAKNYEGRIKYGYGSKDINSGAVDCSGWTFNVAKMETEQVNEALGYEKYKIDGSRAGNVLNHNAANQIAYLAKKNGVVTDSRDQGGFDFSKLQEGMVIGVNKKGNPTNRVDVNGMTSSYSHIVNVIKGDDGQLYISESRGGRNGGVTRTPLQSWANKSKQFNQITAVDKWDKEDRNALKIAKEKQVDIPTSVVNGSSIVAFSPYRTSGSVNNVAYMPMPEISSNVSNQATNISQINNDVNTYQASLRQQNNSMVNSKDVSKQNKLSETTPSVDLSAFLSQDVSERNIAHIVTGGIAQGNNGRII